MKEVNNKKKSRENARINGVRRGNEKSCGLFQSGRKDVIDQHWCDVNLYFWMELSIQKVNVNALLEKCVQSAMEA